MLKHFSKTKFFLFLLFVVSFVKIFADLNQSSSFDEKLQSFNKNKPKFIYERFVTLNKTKNMYLLNKKCSSYDCNKLIQYTLTDNNGAVDSLLIDVNNNNYKLYSFHSKNDVNSKLFLDKIYIEDIEKQKNFN